MAGKYAITVTYELPCSPEDILTITPEDARKLASYIKNKGINSLVETAYQRLRSLLQGNTTARKEIDVRDEALLLFTIPRYLLTVMGLDKKHEKVARGLFENQPLKPGIEATIKIIRRPHAHTSPAMDRAVTISVILALTLAGLGKAVTRGFGRFKITEVESPHNQTFAPGSMPDNKYIEKMVRELQESLKEIVKDSSTQAATTQKILIHTLTDPTGQIQLYTTRTAPHPCPYHTTELDNIYNIFDCFNPIVFNCNNISDKTLRAICMLSAIGKTTLKSTWKAYLIRKNKIKIKHKTKRISSPLETPGANIHTWPL
ncbi:MAG: hypothetical protein LRS48_03060, partial [Desulfurococcales archaeon]|nr:hypothetical protein [Desulfurococcales archaeon]